MEAKGIYVLKHVCIVSNLGIQANDEAIDGQERSICESIKKA